MMRQAVCRFIQCISLSELKLSNKVKKKYIDTLLECLRNPIELTQECARKAFYYFV